MLESRDYRLLRKTKKGDIAILLLYIREEKKKKNGVLVVRLSLS